MRQPGEDLQGRRPGGGGAAGAGPAGRARRVHRPGRRLGQRQEHAAEHPGRARRPVRRPRDGGGAPPRRDGPEGADRLPAPGDRLRLAAVGQEPAAVPDRRRERGAADAAGGRGARRPPGAGHRAAGAGGARRARRPSPRPPLRRRAAARLDRGGHRQSAGRPVRRRADRRAGLGHGAADLRPAAIGERRAWRDDRGRHPRPAGQRARQPDDRHPRRPHRHRDAPSRRGVGGRASTTWWRRSTRCSTGLAACSCRATTSTRSACERRVRLVLEDDHITVWPDRDGDDGSGGAR